MARVDEIAAQEMQTILALFQASDNSRIKLESFGMFLQDYVISGGVVTKVNDSKVNVSEAIISLNDFLWKVYEANVKVPTSDGTYYIDFDADNQAFVCVTQHPTNYIELAQVTVANGGITTITDTRGETGGVRFDENIWGVVEESIAVDTSNIVDGAITNVKLASNAVGTSNIQDDAITNPKIADNAINTSQIQDNAVTNAKIADNAINEDKLADGSVGSNKLQEDSITGTKIADNAVGSNHLTANAVTTDKIATGAVTSNKIADGAVTQAKLAINTINEANLKLDYPTAWLYQVLTMLQTEGSADLAEIIAARQGYTTLSEKLDSMETTIKSQVFTATANQQTFTLTLGEYQPGTNTLTVFVGGVYQKPGVDYTEDSTTQFTLDEGVEAGVEVLAIWYSKQAIPTTYHNNSHKAGGGDELDLGDLAHNKIVTIDGGEW